MKILMDGLQMGNRSGTGGYSRALLGAMVELAGEEHRFVTVCPADIADEVQAETGAEVLPVKLDGPAAGVRYRNGAFGRVIKSQKPDIVHYPANIGRMRRRSRRDPACVVLTVHDLSFYREPKWFRWERARYYRKATRLSVKRSDHVLADSQATADDLVVFLQVPEEETSVTLLGVGAEFAPASEDAISKLRSTQELPEQFFLYVGTIEPRKNLPRLIRAWDATFEEHGWDLVIAGRDGWKTAETSTAMKKVLHRDRLHRIGFVESGDLATLYSAASTLVWPSLWEGFGLPPLEAMACGTPVITSNTSSLPQVVGRAALLVDPENEEQIGQYMVRLAGDAKQQAALRNMGLNRAKELSWRRCAEATLSAYQRALQERKSR